MTRNNANSHSTKLMVNDALDKLVHTVVDLDQSFSFEKSNHPTCSSTVLPDPSKDTGTSQEVIKEELINWTRSNDPMILDGSPIQSTIGDLGLSGDDTTHPRFPRMEPGLAIRHFIYPERAKKIVKWLKVYQLAHRPKDPYHDFHPKFNGRSDPHHQRFPVGRMDPREVQEYVGDHEKWFKTDYLSFYTHWSKMFLSHYDDQRDYFSFYMASDEMTSMVQWSDESFTDIDDSNINVAKIVASIWKRVHPPSYYLHRQKKIDASKDPTYHGYNTSMFRKKKEAFDNVPQTFSIMKKRVISIIAGDGIHFVCYLAINFGAHFKSGDSTQKKEPSFIAKLDSSYEVRIGMNQFVHWLLAIIYELEVWITDFLNTPPQTLLLRIRCYLRPDVDVREW